MVTRLTVHGRWECKFSAALRTTAVDDGADPKRQLSWKDADHLQATDHRRPQQWDREYNKFHTLLPTGNSLARSTFEASNCAFDLLISFSNSAIPSVQLASNLISSCCPNTFTTAVSS
jgi:hypothetical protein